METTIIARIETMQPELRRTERQAHRIAEDICNGAQFVAFKGTEHDTWTDEGHDALTAAIIAEVERIIGQPIPGLFFNGDPRGYTLKVEPEHAAGLHTDWGGYGIVAPSTR